MRHHHAFAARQDCKLVLVPTTPHGSDVVESAFAGANGMVPQGPRTGPRTRHHAIPENLSPGPIARLVKVSVQQFSSLNPGLINKVRAGVRGAAIRSSEVLDANGSEVLASLGSGSVALSLGSTAGRRPFAGGVVLRSRDLQPQQVFILREM
jgi:beta-galactosidase